MRTALLLLLVGCGPVSASEQILQAPAPGVNAGPMIQAALDAGRGSPNLVRLGPGTFYVWPDPAAGVYPGKNCLEIRYSNVTLAGAGRTLTTISCKVAGGLDPNTNWEIAYIGSTPYVWRGHGIELKGPVVANFTMRDLRLTGNSPRNLTLYPVWGNGVRSGVSFPADVTTGENWDSTNKGVFVGNGTTRTNTLIDDCEIDSFRGELVYYGGGSGNQGLVVRDSVLHDAIGSILSCSGGLTYERNDISLGLNAIENTPLADVQVIRGNRIHDCVSGITIPSNAAGPEGGAGRVIAEGNTVERMWGWGSYVQGAVRGVHIRDNFFIDCVGGYGALLSGGAGVGGKGPELVVERNVIRLERTDLPGGSRAFRTFQINSDLGYPGRVVMVGNRSERSKSAADAGHVLSAPVFDSYEPAQSFDVHDNDWSGGDPANYGPGEDVSGDRYWVYGSTPAKLQPTLVFNGASRLFLDGGYGPATFTTWSGAPINQTITVRINWGISIGPGPTLILANGTPFISGPAGGVIWFFRPAGSAKLYEFGRLAY